MGTERQRRRKLDWRRGHAQQARNARRNRPSKPIEAEEPAQLLGGEHVYAIWLANAAGALLGPLALLALVISAGFGRGRLVLPACAVIAVFGEVLLVLVTTLRRGKKRLINIVGINLLWGSISVGMVVGLWWPWLAALLTGIMTFSAGLICMILSVNAEPSQEGSTS